MEMSTRTLASAGALLASVLVDSLQVYNVGAKVTVGASVSRPLSAVGSPISGLVQSTTLANAAESRSESVYSIKVARLTALRSGQAVKVLSCAAEPSLVGAVLFVDKMSQNGLALIRKGTASVAETINTEGKEGLA